MRPFVFVWMLTVLAVSLCAQSKSKQAPKAKAAADIPQPLDVNVVQGPPQPITVKIDDARSLQPLKVELIESSWKASDTVAVCVALIALCTGLVTYSQWRTHIKIFQYETFERVLQDIKANDLFNKEYDNLVEDAEQQIDGGKLDPINPTPAQRAHFQALDRRKEEVGKAFFNSVEYLALLVNKKVITEPELTRYFKDAVIFWHDSILKNHYPDWFKEEKMFREFRTYYRSLKV